MASSTSIPKGTRDFSPEVLLKRNFIFDILKKTFQLYGYQPIETPAMEHLSTLMGKYGEEGDKLIFKILNSGDFTEDLKNIDVKETNSQKLANLICEKALKYDLTVPFARFVVQHQNEITFPFRRYQMQPVWRADRPQKGRYREFYQCDVDIIGTKSLLCEVELLNIVADVFNKLQIKHIVKVNNRKILTGIAEYIGFPDKIIDITIAIDKIDKIGVDKVIEELHNKGISKDATTKLLPILNMQGTSNNSKLNTLQNLLNQSAIGMLGIQEVTEMLDNFSNSCQESNVEIDFSLARGLNYYTGAIFEVKAKDMAIGSIAGGGRYDNLTEFFGLDGMSGVGISFGADRIYDVMTELNLFPENLLLATKVLCINFDTSTTKKILSYINQIRQRGISIELYPDVVKVKKQFDYANRKKIPYVLIIGEEELKQQKFTLKDMKTGTQSTLSMTELLEKLR